MFKTGLLSVSLMLGFCSTGLAATVTSFTGNTTFFDRCDLGTANGFECEVAIADFRGGNAADNGLYEQRMHIPGASGLSVVGGQFAWVSGQAYDFELSYAPDETLTLSVGTPAQSISMALGTTGTGANPPVYNGLSDVNTMFIRIRNNSATETLSLNDMMLNGIDIGDLTFGQSMDDGTNVGIGADGSGYLQITGFNFADPWSLTGKVTLDWDGASVPPFSLLNADFKLTAIPLPATALLLIAGLAGLAAVKRRRS